MNDRQGRAGRKVAVLGPIPRDEIVTLAGEWFEKYGCMLYTAQFNGPSELMNQVHEA